MDELVSNFCAVTGASVEKAGEYLKATDNNLENAIELFLASGETGTESIPALPADEPLQSETDDDVLEIPPETEAEEVRAPMRRTSGPLVDQFEMPFRFERPVVRGPLNPFDQVPVDPFRDFSRESRLARNNENATETSTQRRLADLFRPPFDILFTGTFEEARQRAREAKLWLLVNVQDVQEFACQVLNRDLWSDSMVKDFVKETFVFVQFSSQTGEGERYLSYYPVENYPHIAIIDPITGERLKFWNYGVTPAEFIQEASDFLDQVNPAKKTRLSPIELDEDEQLRIAMSESLQESEKSKPPVDSDIPVVDIPEPGAGEDATRIQIRFPNGNRIVRKFLKSDPVLNIFSFIKFTDEEAKTHKLDLFMHKVNLREKLNLSIKEAGLENSSLTVVLE